jgi:hypothetical protein
MQGRQYVAVCAGNCLQGKQYVRRNCQFDDSSAASLKSYRGLVLYTRRPSGTRTPRMSASQYHVTPQPCLADRC